MKRGRKIGFKILGFILSPFAGAIRYGALKLMKRFRAPDDRRPIIAASDHMLDEIILPSIFFTFKGERFRELAGFKKLPVAEHDRIFNELEAAGINLAIYCLRAAKYEVKLEDYHFWQGVEEHLPKQLQRILIGHGVDGSNAKLMRELIEMRQEEYEEIAEKVLETSDEYKPEFKELPPEAKRFASRIQATAVSTADHIFRGRLKAGDPLTRFLIDWLISLKREVDRFIKRL